MEAKTILAMPRDLIMFRKFYEDSGDTAAWQELHSQLSEEDKEELMDLVSRPVAEIKTSEIPQKYEKIMPYYFLKTGSQASVKHSKEMAKQISFDDVFAMLDDELKDD